MFNIRQVEGETEVVDIYYFVSRPTLPVTYLRSAHLDGNVWINKAQVSCFRVWGITTRMSYKPISFLISVRANNEYVIHVLPSSIISNKTVKPIFHQNVNGFALGACIG